MYPIRICKERRCRRDRIPYHGHTLNSFRLPCGQRWVPSHIVILEHTQAERNQSIIRVQLRSVNKSDGYTLPGVGNLVHYRVEHHLVWVKESFGLFLYEPLETTLVSGKLVILRETAGSNVESVVVTLNQR